VDWYPWGEEALARAREEDKPIFLSIGYAACHWCHVMAHESFEHPDTAAFLNGHFINIKVDREERPDLDAIYMQATVGMTGHGGWPMSVWLTPDGVPFHAGTYFPPEPRHGMPSFRRVLEALAQAWHDQRDRILENAGRVLEVLQTDLLASDASETITVDPADVVRRLEAVFDRRNGGWGDAPKFPQPMLLDYLLRVLPQTPTGSARDMLDTTLDRMADGGIHDLLGGGFHRYATDAQWLVPHFEKMLYDNAQLARVYLHAWQATGTERYRAVARGVLDYVIREMRHPTGGFFSSQDADSEGVEGRFFVWSADAFLSVAADDGDLAARAWDVSETGNWEGTNILHRLVPVHTLAEERRQPVEDIEARLASVRQRLWESRETRVKPGLDDKVLTSWNGLMLAAFAEAAWVWNDPAYLEVARANGAFLLRTLRTSEGRLLRVWTEAGGAALNGYLEDYSHAIEGLLSLYQATFERQWFEAARELAEVMITRFGAEGGGFFDTSDDHERLITRPREVQDNAVPSGGAMAATVLAKLAAFTGESRYTEIARTAVAQIAPHLARHPLGFGQWLQAAELLSRPALEVAVVGPRDDPDTHRLLDVLRPGFHPSRVMACADPSEESTVPLLQGRGLIEGRPAAYVCRDFVCHTPVTDPADLRKLLAPDGV
jgi:uncharacterized protein YyaL (SSP411 family)